MKVFPFIILLLLSFISACEPRDSSLLDSNSSKEKTIRPFKTLFHLPIGESSLQIQLAVHESEMKRGLMYRDSLAEDHGMIFLYKEAQTVSYWMKDVSFPIDIGFFDEAGKLLEIRHMFPFDENSVKSRSDSVKFALEVNRSWFSKKSIKPGLVLDIQCLKDMLYERGIEPGIYFTFE